MISERNEESEDDTENIVINLHEATANSLINNAAIKLCLHSYGIQAILTGEEGDHDMQKYEKSNNLNLKIVEKKKIFNSFNIFSEKFMHVCVNFLF